jgi:hypothetical protein
MSFRMTNLMYHVLNKLEYINHRVLIVRVCFMISMPD